MKKYEEPTMKFHQLKTASIIATSPGSTVNEVRTFTGNTDESGSGSEPPATQEFTYKSSSSVWN